MKAEYKIKGMSCAGCATALQNRLSKKDGINKVFVSYANESMQIEYDENRISAEEIQNLVEDMGYNMKEDFDNEEQLVSNDEEKKQLDLFFKKVVVALILTVVVVFLAMGLHIPWVEEFVRQIPLWTNYSIQFVLTAIVMFWSGFYIYKSCFLSIIRGVFNMNVLVGIGTLAAFLVSIAGILFPGFFLEIADELPVYFEAAAGIAAFIITGKYLEEKAKKSTKGAVNKLLSLQEKKQ
ncbi:cation transporter [Candidatus Absconditicoccus praedator]|uniref:cation transporter n=1 Tax=Candidatus Absconditicoccus praedator TaxID=2735562 RepID=UPI001E651E4E|nr:cation transporter [Candidatus Absconditicoccus praedator]UFX83221.1 cation-translocating P-type ATPase [Candidatus Absconditicoccus praedator]